MHRAITHDGRAVAVKVQYPGVGEAIRADLDNAGLLFGAMGMLFPGLEPEPLVAELRDRLVEELDYRLEADNQRLLRATSTPDHPFIHVPAVVDELCAERVLTTELAEGVRFDERARRGARPSATSPPRRSSASCSAASTGSTPSTATPTRATTSSARAAR